MLTLLEQTVRKVLARIRGWCQLRDRPTVAHRPKTSPNAQGPAGEGPSPSSGPHPPPNENERKDGIGPSPAGVEGDDQAPPEEGSEKEPRTIGGKRGKRPGRTRSSPLDLAPPPDLIVVRKGPKWEVVLSMPDNCDLKSVLHNGSALEPNGDKCIPPSIKGSLSIVYGGGRKKLNIPLFEDKAMVFKLGTDWSGQGRSLSRITHGYFIVIAPREWTRVGEPPVVPEDCTDDGFRAHYFHRSKDDSDEVVGFEECSLGLNDVSADLVGTVIDDDAASGRLFGGCPPCLKPARGIAWARIGEEGGDWSGENFKPAEKTLAEVLEERQGHFYLRVYNGKTKLQDSCEFRYLRNLKEIRVNGEPHTRNSVLGPGPEGHEAAIMSFVPTANDIRLEPVVLSAHAQSSQGCVVIDPCPEADDVRCTLESDGASVDIRLHLPRIWWRVEQGTGDSAEWGTTPLDLTRRQFAEWAREGAAIRVRLPRRLRSVGVGFNDALDRRYPTERKDNQHYVQLLLPLAHFVAYSQIAERLNEDAVLKIDCGEAKVALVQVAPDPLPRINSFTCDSSMIEKGQRATLRWETSNTEAVDVTIEPVIGSVPANGSMDVAPTTNTPYTLRLTTPGLDAVTRTINVAVGHRGIRTSEPLACVMTGHGKLRRGKGFSLSEIRAASITMQDAKRLPIRIDKRRRTTHGVNIATIKDFSSV